MFEKVLKSLSPGTELLNFELLPRNQLNENNEWVPDTPAIFISILYDEDLDLRSGKLEHMLTEFTGREVIIEGGLSVRKSVKKITINFDNE